MSQSGLTLFWTVAAVAAPVAVLAWMTRSKWCCCCKGKECDNRCEDVPQIDPNDFRPFTLTKREPLTHNTTMYRFSLADSTRPLGLKPGQHVQIRAKMADGQEVIKPYTPISLCTTVGHFDLLIKTYPEGRVSQYMDKLHVGDSVDMRGPKGSFVYSSNLAEHVGMIAGGTGITPVLSVIRAMLNDNVDNTRITLLFANRTSEDVLVEHELKDLQENNPSFKYHLTVDEPDEKWDGLKGRVTADMLKQVGMPEYASNALICMCGPPVMMTAMQRELEQLGYDKPLSDPSSRIVKF